MRLGISNIAWEREEDDAVLQVLRRHAVDAIDVAPTKYFPDPLRATEAEIRGVRCWWAERGIEIVGMQALLFGTQGLNLFDAAAESRMLRYLGAVCRIGAELGARRLVFGAPASRDRGALGDEEAMRMAVVFFRRLGLIAQKHGVMLCLEPVPRAYGANFMTSSAEAAAVVRQVGHPAIRMQLDVGSLAANGEDAGEVLERSAALIGHVHASEPGLVPLGDAGTDHAAAARAIARHLPQSIVVVEMRATSGEPHVQAIDRALGVASRHYRDAPP